MNEIEKLDILTITIRILLAVIIGGIIGSERSRSSQAAGFRTYSLVCMGSSIIMMTNQYISMVYTSGDPSRMGAQVISGIGFIGAGTILTTKNNRIKGLTTAAGIWVAAAIGLAIGIGFYSGALIGSLAIFIVMSIFKNLKNYVQKRSKSIDIYVVLSSVEAYNRLLIYLTKKNIGISILQNGLIDFDAMYQADEKKSEIGCYLGLKARDNFDHLKLMEMLLKVPGVRYVEEIK